MADKREIFINRAIAVHGKKYDYSKVEIKKAHDKLCIICPEHGEFWQDQYSHLNGHGCPECAKNNREKKYTTKECVEKCKLVWGDKYSYEHTIYNGITEFLTITCPIHGDFRIRANDFLNGHGCQKCVGRYRPTTEEWIEKARGVHGDEYDYSKVNYINNTTKICIICPEHGEFWQTPSRHLSGDRCPKCFKSEKKTTKQFIDEAKAVHGDKYDYSKVVYQKNKKKVEIICPQHGSFFMTPLYHLQRHGCPYCKESRLESVVNSFLLKSGVLFIRQKKFDWLDGKSLDFYIPRYKLAIECQGLQHFKPIEYFGGKNSFNKQVKYDVAKRAECQKHGINVIYVIENNNRKEIDYGNPIYENIYINNIHFVDEIKTMVSDLVDQ